MTVERSIEQSLPEILAGLGAGPAPDYADLVLERVAHTRQRPTWVFPERWIPLDFAARRNALQRPLLVLLVILLTLAVGAAAVYIGSRPRLPAPFGPALNGSLVYGSQGDIFAGTPGGSSTLIVGGPEFDFGAFYSPDGSKVAFYRRADQSLDGATDILVADADGSHAQLITPRPLREIPWSAIWTPDGSEIAVMTSQRADGRLEFFDATMAAEPRVFDPGLRMDTFAFQPPDGRRILFNTQLGNKVGLYVIDRDGTNLTTLIPPYEANIPQNAAGYWNLTSDIRDLRNSIWSPDGQRIVFQQAVLPKDARQARLFLEMHLFMMDADGTNLRPITTGESIDAYPAWSPDGMRIAFLRYRLDVDAWTYAVLRRSDGFVTRTGPAISDGMGLGADWSPGLATIAWSPDSTALLAIARYQRGTYLLDPDGGPARPLPWTIETPKSWGVSGFLNGFDPGSWQRKASP